MLGGGGTHSRQAGSIQGVDECTFPQQNHAILVRCDQTIFVAMNSVVATAAAGSRLLSRSAPSFSRRCSSQAKPRDPKVDPAGGTDFAFWSGVAGVAVFTGALFDYYRNKSRQGE